MTGPVLLPPRDRSILRMVHAYGGCTVSQVKKRLFGGQVGPRTCYRRVAGLLSSDYLRSQRLPASAGIGSGKAFLTLTPRGRAVVAAAEGMAVAELRRHRASKARFIEHHLAIGDTRIAFEQAAESGSAWQVTDWCVDRETTIEVPVDGQGAVQLVPDSTFTLRRGAVTVRVLLEQDTGTLTHRGRMRLRLQGYLRYTQRTPALVLFVTTSPARVDALAELALEVAGSGVVLTPAMGFTTTELVALQDPLCGPIWRMPGNKTNHTMADVFGTIRTAHGSVGGPIG